MKSLRCQHCGGTMRKRTTSSGNCAGILLGLIVVCAGIAIGVLFFWTIVAPVIGILMVLLGLIMGGKRAKVWRCTRCHCTLARA